MCVMCVFFEFFPTKAMDQMQQTQYSIYLHSCKRDIFQLVDCRRFPATFGFFLLQVEMGTVSPVPRVTEFKKCWQALPKNGASKLVLKFAQ